MRFLGGLLLLGSLTAAAWADDVPGILVVQSNAKTEIVESAKKGSVNDPKVPGVPAFDRAKFETSLVPLTVVEVTSAEIEEDGKLSPVSWLLTDPIFRAAVEDRLIPPPADYPGMPEVQAAMPKFRVGYVLLVSAFVGEGKVWTTAHLFKGDKEIWKDEVRNWQTQSIADIDTDNAKRSIARTWIQLISNGPLKDLPQKKKASTPAPGQGTGFQNEAPIPVAPVDNKQLLADTERLMGASQFAEAVNLLRDAVDAAPLDMERRSALIAALLRSGEPELAAREARRAARLLPERVELWVLAARAWIGAGKEDEAVEDLNEAVSRDAEGRETRLLLGEMQVSQKRFPLAIEHFTKVLEKGPSAYVLRARAFAYAGLGMEAEMQADLDEAQKVTAPETGEEVVRRQKATLKTGLDLCEELSGQVRSLIQRVRLAPSSSENKSEVAAASSRAGTLSRYISAAGSHPKHTKSTETLLLALKLLAQSLADLSGSLDKLDEDALTEAAINLGESIKALTQSKAELAQEIS